MADLKIKQSRPEIWEKIKTTYIGHDTKNNIYKFLSDQEYKKTLDNLFRKLEGLDNVIISIEEIKNGPEFEKIFDDLKKDLNKFNPEKIAKDVIAEFKEWLSDSKSLIQDKTKLSNLHTTHISKELKLEILDNRLKKKFNTVVQKFLGDCKKSQVEPTYNQKIIDLDNLYEQLDSLINNLTNLSKEELVFCKKRIDKIAIGIINKNIIDFEENLEVFNKKLLELNNELELFLKNYWNDETSKQFDINLFSNEEHLFKTDLSNFYIENMKNSKFLKDFFELQKNWYSKLVEVIMKIKKII